jgi:hypothetical protein
MRTVEPAPPLPSRTATTVGAPERHWEGKRAVERERKSGVTGTGSVGNRAQSTEHGVEAAIVEEARRHTVPPWFE